DENGNVIGGMSFGTTAGATWVLSAFYGDDVPSPNGSGTGLVYPDSEGSGRGVIQTFRMTADEDAAVHNYMEKRFDDVGRYNLYPHSCIQFCNQQFDYIKSQILKSRSEYHSPVIGR